MNVPQSLDVAVSGTHQWTVTCADLLITFFVHLLHHCKGDISDSYDFINLVMCFVNKSQIKFFLKYMSISAAS